MLPIGGNAVPSTTVQTLQDPKTDPVADDKETSTAPLSETKVVEGVVVTISGAALKAAGAQKSANSDIDDSGLDDNVKQILKMIRQLKQQIAEKMAEIAAVSADKSLTPEQVQAKVGNLQAAVAGLQAGLMTAQTSLAKAMKTLDAQSALKAASLAMV
jgi:prefoldin subunit 5